MEKAKLNLSIDEKIDLTSGVNMWELPSFNNDKENRIRCSDGPCGVRFVNDVNYASDNEITDASLFLAPSSAANTFNPELLYKLGEGLGKEAKHKNVDLLLAPGINIKRTPLCGRNFEYFSEDPYLSGILASALVNGIQEQHVGVCIKHLACNNTENYRYTNSSIVDERTLNELYLNPFRLVIEKSNPIAVMTSYNKLNYKYVAENKELLDKMRSDYNFRGLFISDWGGVNDPVESLKAGLNIEMPGNTFSKKLIKEAYDNNLIDEEILNKNAEYIQQNYDILYKNREYKIEYDKDKIKDIAYTVAKEAPVLLKNENNALPLKEDENLLFVGSLFLNPNIQGYGSSRLNVEKNSSFKDEIAKFNPNFIFKEGYSQKEELRKKLRKDCLKEATKHHKIIMFMGYYTDDCEGIDRKNIDLPIEQLELLNELIKLNKQIIVVLNTGNVVALPFKNDVDAIIQSGLLGEVHEQVISEILFGKINPSGKLSETYPVKFKDNYLLAQHDKSSDLTLYKESLYCGYRYYDSFRKDVAFPFGHGISYSKFKFTNLTVIKEDKYRFAVSFIVENESDIEGSEVCQIYVRKKTSNTYHSYQQLKGFKKIKLQPHEKTNVNIILEDHAFEFYNDLSHKFEIESGVYEICVGNSSRNIDLVEFINIEGNETNLRFKLSDLSSYFRYKQIENFEFQKLLGFKINEPVRTKYDFNSTVESIKDKKIGLIIYKKMKKQYINNFAFLPEDEIIEMMNFIPIRMIVSMSSGAMDYEFAETIINALNTNFIKGSYILNKYLKAHKDGVNNV